MSEATKPASSGILRKLILFGVLGLLLVGLAYDYKVARPAVDEAYAKLDKLNMKAAASSTDTLGKAEIQEAIGREPSDTFNDGTDLVEVYSWRSGLPVRTHNLYAVYKPVGDDHVFYRMAKFKYDKKGDVMAITTPTQVLIDPDDDSVSEEAPQPGEPTPDGGGAPGGGGGGLRERGAAMGLSPEAVFDENDENGDGQLRDEEISPEMRDQMGTIDKDSDGAISKEEFTAMMEARFSGGDGPEGGRGNRPPADDETPETEETPESEESPVPDEASGSEEAPAAEEAPAEAEASESEEEAAEGK